MRSNIKLNPYVAQVQLSKSKPQQWELNILTTVLSSSSYDKSAWL